jgi:hypothetical protein
VTNDNLPIDLENQQIIYQFKQVIGSILNQFSYILRKGLIKYNKTNGITLMKTHIDYAHPCLVAKRKLQLTNKFMVKFS